MKLFVLPAVLCILVALFDFAFWRGTGRNRLLAAALIASYLPIAVMALTELLIRDNTIAWVRVSMWLFWSWLLLSVPRVVYGLLRMARLPRVGVALALLTAGGLVWGATVGRTTLHVNRVEICSPKLPASFEGFRLVQLSDMHVGTLVDSERELRQLVDRVNALQPDLILFTGDLVNVRAAELNDRVAASLRDLKAPYGVVSVTGNHDAGVYIKDSLTYPAAQSLSEVIAWQRRIGWEVLEDTTRYLTRGMDSISLSGISFDPELRKKRHDRHLPPARLDELYRGVPDTLFNITAVHLPQLWEQILETPYGDLTLAGHVHSMQMKLHLFGTEFSPARLLYKRWSGRYDDGGRTLYINDGTGYVTYPMRLGAWPEITLITLHRCE